MERRHRFGDLLLPTRLFYEDVARSHHVDSEVNYYQHCFM